MCRDDIKVEDKQQDTDKINLESNGVENNTFFFDDNPFIVDELKKFYDEATYLEKQDNLLEKDNKENNSFDYDNVNNLLKNNNNINVGIDVDKEFDNETKHQLNERDQLYTQLLSDFVKLNNIKGEQKETYKWYFFEFVLKALLAFIILSFVVIGIIILKCNPEEFDTIISAIIAETAGVASVLIAIPLTIAKYLFDTEEDKYPTAIIQSTQQHDLSNRQILRQLRRKRKKTPEDTKKVHDSEEKNNSKRA